MVRQAPPSRVAGKAADFRVQVCRYRRATTLPFFCRPYRSSDGSHGQRCSDRGFFRDNRALDKAFAAAGPVQINFLGPRMAKAHGQKGADRDYPLPERAL